VVDENTLRRLLASEAHRMNENVVLDTVGLRRVLEKDQATARTKGGAEHRFDAEEVARFAKPLSALLRVRLSVPVRFTMDHRVPGSAFVSDPVFKEALEAHGVSLGAFKDGRSWLSLPRAQEFARRFPTLVQFLRQ
jgi:uncharacterized protein (UPF0216 family)